MKRRGFLKFLGIAAVAPVAIAKALSKVQPDRPMYILTENSKPIAEIKWPSAWQTEAAVNEEIRKAEPRIDVMDMYKEDGTRFRRIGYGKWEAMPNWRNRNLLTEEEMHKFNYEGFL